MIVNQASLTYGLNNQVIKEQSNLVQLLEMKPFLSMEYSGKNEITFHNTTNCPIFQFTVQVNNEIIHAQSYVAKNSQITFLNPENAVLFIHYQVKKNQHLEHIYWLYDWVKEKDTTEQHPI